MCEYPSAKGWHSKDRESAFGGAAGFPAAGDATKSVISGWLLKRPAKWLILRAASCLTEHDLADIRMQCTATTSVRRIYHDRVSRHMHSSASSWTEGAARSVQVFLCAIYPRLRTLSKPVTVKISRTAGEMFSTFITACCAAALRCSAIRLRSPALEI